MIPRHFFDIDIRGGDQVGIPFPLACGIVVQVLHGAFRSLPSRYALAFPRPHFFAAVRVFASERAELDALVEAIRHHPKVRDYTRLGYPQSVPAGFRGKWVEYRRYRIPTRKSDREPGTPLRAKRIADADKRRLPYLMLSSRSTGSQFGLYVEPIVYNDAGAERLERDCRPDGYGLSGRDKAFALPMLP